MFLIWGNPVELTPRIDMLAYRQLVLRVAEVSGLQEDPELAGFIKDLTVSIEDVVKVSALVEWRIRWILLLANDVASLPEETMNLCPIHGVNIIYSKDVFHEWIRDGEIVCEEMYMLC